MVYWFPFEGQKAPTGKTDINLCYSEVKGIFL